MLADSSQRRKYFYPLAFYARNDKDKAAKDCGKQTTTGECYQKLITQIILDHIRGCTAGFFSISKPDSRDQQPIAIFSLFAGCLIYIAQSINPRSIIISIK